MMASVAASILTGIVVGDLVKFDQFLREHGLKHFHLFTVKNSIYLGVDFTVRGELMIYRLMNLEEEFKLKDPDKYIYGFDGQWDWQEVFGNDAGEE